MGPVPPPRRPRGRPPTRAGGAPQFSGPRAPPLVPATLPAASFAQSITRPFDGDNQKASVSQWIGPVKVTVDYSSPDVHSPTGQDRTGKIWGELVPYGLHDLGFNDCKECPWRAGANENTVFTVSHDVKVEGKPLKAGSYGLHMIAGPEEWTVIFSSNSTSWGSFSYDPAEDVLRVQVKPAKSEYHEWLTYDFTDRQPDKATVALRWENLQVPIRIAVDDIDDVYIAQIKRELRNWDGYSWTNWVAAADYCVDHKTHLEDGLYFATRAVEWKGIGVSNFRTLSTLTRLQVANGMTDEAAKTMARALAQSEASDPIQVHGFARQLQLMGENKLALSVFETNAKRHPNAWPVNLGLARGWSGVGDKRKAVFFARKALPQAPDEPNRKNIEGLIQQWEGGTAKN
jgi:hypothetical protein